MANTQEYAGEARAALLAGVAKLNKAVSVTLGPAGRNVLFRHMGAVFSTKDGVTVAREIQLVDPFESMGADLVKMAASQTVDEAGDGTTTATLLTHAIFEAGCKAINEGAEPVQLTRGIEKAVTAIVGEYDAKARKFSGGILETFAVPCTPELAFNAARISCNGDEAIARVVSEVVLKVGIDGALTIGDSNSQEHSYEVAEGLQIASGLAHPYFINDQFKPRASVDGCIVLVVNRGINTEVEAVNLVKAAAKHAETRTRQFALLVIADDYTPEALASFLHQKKANGTQIVCVRAALWGDARRDQLDDICLVTGATRIESPAGKAYENLRTNVFGFAEKVVSTLTHTVITTGSMDTESPGTEKMASHLARLQAIVDDLNLRPDQIDAAKGRLAALRGGVAVIKVGGTSAGSVQETKFRVEDAIHATRAAVADGVVPGGGSALLFAAQKMIKASASEADDAGSLLLFDALYSPVEQIAKNAGFDADKVTSNILNLSSGGEHPNAGFDASDGTYPADMIAAGIVDPLRVVRASLNAAASAACILLKTEAVIAQDPATQPQGVNVR